MEEGKLPECGGGGDLQPRSSRMEQLASEVTPG